MIIKNSGLFGHNTWGMMWMTWDDMTSVEPITFWGFDYLKVDSQKLSSSMLIPLYLNNLEKFIIAVCDRAPASNPLRLALENNNFQSLKKADFKKFDTDNINTNEIFQRYKTAIQNYLINFALSLKTSNSSIVKTLVTRKKPWMKPNIFPCVPKPETYGYKDGEILKECSLIELSELLEHDTEKQIKLIWIPESLHLTPPEEVPFLFKPIRTRTLNRLRQTRTYAILGLIYAISGLILSFLFDRNSKETSPEMSGLFLFIFGFIPLSKYAWDYYRYKTFTPTVMTCQIPEVRYEEWMRNFKASWTWALVGCIALVYTVQIIVGFEFLSNRPYSAIEVGEILSQAAWQGEVYSAIEAAGIVKQAVWQGEVWRLMTGTLLHGNLIHFLFNAIALLGLGKLVEAIAHRVYLPIIFLISALSGSLFSLIFLPDATSVGASGGILGLLGFLVVLAWKQRQYLPLAFGRMLLVNIVYIVAIGFLAREIIDNAAHFGGFVAGLLLGILLIPNSERTISPRLSFLLIKGSMLAGILILSFTMVSAIKMLNV
jgi:membrane associated rhomboid family serine protease